TSTLMVPSSSAMVLLLCCGFLNGFSLTVCVVNLELPDHVDCGHQSLARSALRLPKVTTHRRLSATLPPP
ncbi:MAG: hypothetical protein R3308_01970, partial [Thiohalobacterales bacterium]|nr:hypothetical protein [Thiohalobacterales bacterium]